MTDPARGRAVIRRTAMVAGAALLLAAGCGPTARTPAQPLPPTAPPTEDLTIELTTTTLEGTVFVPQGLPAPPVPVVRPKRRTTLDKQRAAWKKLAADGKAPLARKALEAQVLATLLFEKLVLLAPEAPTREPMLAEARAALAAVRDVAGDQVDQVTLEMAAALALGVADLPGATPYLEALIARVPEAPAARMARAQLGYAQLRAGKDAAATVEGLEPSAASPDAAYIIAWVKFRAGDGPGAATAITAAASGWKDAATRPGLVRDVLIMSSRGGVAPAGAADIVAGLLPDGPARAAALLDLGRAYDLAGRADDALAAFDLALGLGGAALDPSDQLAARRSQADLARKAGRVADLGRRWRAVADALARCPACPDEVRGAVASELAQRAYELHTVHITSGDARYKTAAIDLYRVHAGLPGAPDATAVAAHARDLDHARVPEDGGQYD